MTGWIRCRTCRTLGAPLRTPFCPACGDELRPADPGHEAPALELQAGHDLRRSTGILTALGIMGAAGLAYFFFFSLGSDWGWISVVGLLVLIAGAAFFLSRRDDPKVAAAGRVVLKGLAVFGALFMAGVALVFALLVYLFVACASGNLRVGG